MKLDIHYTCGRCGMPIGDLTGLCEKCEKEVITHDEAMKTLGRDLCLSCGEYVWGEELSGGWCAECNGDLANCESCDATINGYFGPLCGVCENDRSFVEDRGPGRAAKTVKVKK